MSTSWRGDIRRIGAGGGRGKGRTGRSKRVGIGRKCKILILGLLNLRQSSCLQILCLVQSHLVCECRHISSCRLSPPKCKNNLGYYIKTCRQIIKYQPTTRFVSGQVANLFHEYIFNFHTVNDVNFLYLPAILFFLDLLFKNLHRISYLRCILR